MCQVKVFHYQYQHIYPLFIYHIQFCKELVGVFYDDDTINIGYNLHVEVDNTINFVVRNNHWLNLMLQNITYYVLNYHH